MDYKLEEIAKWSVPFMLQFLSDMVDEKVELGQLVRKDEKKEGIETFRRGNQIVKRFRSTDLMKYGDQIKKALGGK